MSLTSYWGQQRHTEHRNRKRFGSASDSLLPVTWLLWALIEICWIILGSESHDLSWKIVEVCTHMNVQALNILFNSKDEILSQSLNTNSFILYNPKTLMDAFDSSLSQDFANWFWISYNYVQMIVLFFSRWPWHGIPCHVMPSLSCHALACDISLNSVSMSFAQSCFPVNFLGPPIPQIRSSSRVPL